MSLETDKNGVKNTTDHVNKAYMGIRQMLFYNEIGPDQKIAYRDLAERLQMSVTPVIQALKWLELQGLVRREHNRGYYTEPISLKQVEEIYDLREVIETSLLSEAIKHLDELAIKKLHKALQLHTIATNEASINERLLRDMELHMAIANLANCKTQSRVLENLFDLLYLKYRGSVLFASRYNTSSEHKMIVDSVISRNLSASKKALSGHIRNIKKLVLEGLSHSIKEREASVF